MALVRGRDTRPELVVRSLVHAMGYRFRLHRRDLPGCPDLVLPRYRAAILVHGCFWHRHADPACKLARLPKSRLDFWLPKLEANRCRDDTNLEALGKQGWRALVVWECELRHPEQVRNTIRDFLSGSAAHEGG